MSCPHIHHAYSQAKKRRKIMRKTNFIVMFACAVIVFIAAGAFAADTKTESTVGLMLGDPIAATYSHPVTEKTSLNVHAGIWTWSFWHDIRYDTPYLSVDYVVNIPIRHIPFLSYIGGGFAVFFEDNPKDHDDYDVCAAVRLPIGFEFYRKDNFSVGFEIAPIYQFAPPYNAKPYMFELNGGLMLGYSF
jgi:hypothetical protein